jgi:hypothetical protein
MVKFTLIILCCVQTLCISQGLFPHPNAHSHNDYEHTRPLWEALQNGFISVEADVHYQNEKLLISHNTPGNQAPTLAKLYLAPLDSLLKINGGRVYAGQDKTFYLMIDCKTESESTYQAIRQSVNHYPSLLCSSIKCPVKIFLSGNRAIRTLSVEGYSGIGIDGRPEDLGKGFSTDLMPVISDNFNNWSTWNGNMTPSSNELERIKNLAVKVHSEGKKLRLWAIPDNEIAWSALLEAGVDMINTDHLRELHHFLSGRGR